MALAIRPPAIHPSYFVKHCRLSQRGAQYGDCSIVGLDPRTKARRRGELSWMVAGRVRLLPAGVRAEGHRRRVPDRYFKRHAGHPADIGDAPGRRIHFRPRRRSLGPPADLDGQHPAVLGARIRVGLRAKPDGPDHSARAVRRRDGRRMGRRRLADDGNHPAACPRVRFGPAAIGLPDRIFHGVDRLWRAVSLYRMARHVHGRRDPGIAGALHPAQRAGIAELEQGGRGRTRRHA